MTVCVAAISEGRVIGASDRMLTSGDIEFEPLQSKIQAITNSVAAMIAGDMALQTEILINVMADVQSRIASDVDHWWRVKDVADLYFHHYEEARNLRTAQLLLHPLGLDHSTYRNAPPDLVARIATDLVNFAMPQIEAVFIGVDEQGPHIYSVKNNGVLCQDWVGFAAIGVGSQHSNSQLMFAGHVKSKGMPETLLSVYAAKKRAEVAPGVGEGTDMCLIGPTKGTYMDIGEHVLSEMQECYDTILQEAQSARERMNGRINQYVEDLGKATAPQEQSSSANIERDTEETGTDTLPTVQ
jgi:20S proteasome alpha/beta subunit